MTGLASRASGLRRAARSALARSKARTARLPGLPLHLALAFTAYVPLLLTRPGWVSADTKTYLYLDPGRLLSRAWSMWDPSIGLGTVTHQNIGYLWPMGPFYWVMDRLGVPDWTAQRLWWGSIIFVAGAGVAYLLRTLGWRGPGVTAATFVYAFSPFLLTLVSRLSALLLPFAVLPWLLALTIQTVRHRGWRHPALFALAVATFGSVNATALVLVGIAPVLWLAHSVWGAREATVKQATQAALKIGALTVPVSAWWIAGLSVQSTDGIKILEYTETAETVATVSVAHEVLRGLGYWFFYGTDRLGPWIEASLPYTQWVPMIGLTYLIPILGLTGAVIARWRHRAYFVLLVLVGTILAVGAYPWDEGPVGGRLIQAFLESDLGLAMRSLPRAAPLVVLGVAVLLGSGVACLARRYPRTRRYAGPAVALLAVVGLPALWLGQFVPDNLRRHENLPTYWDEAAEHLDSADDNTRVLVVPGSDFASYRWGNTVDPVLPGLIDRPSVARELIPYGSPASANLLNALDLGLQERTATPEAIAPIARLLRAGEVLVVSDLQYERYNTPRPRVFWDFMRRTDLGEPVPFGPGAPNVTVEDVQLDDELFLISDPDLPDPPELAALPVEDPVPIVTTHPTRHPVLVAGDGTGLVDAAGQGLIDGTELIRYSAEMSPDGITAALDNDPVLLVTDTNRKRGERWSTVRHTRGYTETADGGVLGDDLTDNRLPVFPDADTESQTIAVNRSGIDARATSYGNPITFTPEERPALAVDGDPLTAWRTAAFSDARGERLELTLSEPVTTDRVLLQQPTTGALTRFIEDVRLTFDGRDPVDVTLGPESRGASGQVVTFPERTFDRLTIEIRSDTAGDVPRYAGESSVGFSRVEIGEDTPRIDEIIRLPRNLLDAAGSDSIDHALAISMTRLRQDPTDVTRHDEELHLARLFSLPTERSFDLSGSAVVSLRTSSHVRDELLGRPHDGSVPRARASSTMTGSPHTPAAAFDGDPTTAWSTVRSRPENQWVEILLPDEVSFDGLPVTLVADGHHSVPTEIELWVDGDPGPRIDVGPVTPGPDRGDTVTVELDLPEEVTGSRFRLKITEVAPVMTNDWIADREVAQPAAIADVAIPEARVPALDETFDSGCRDDLLAINGRSVPVRVTGPMDDAVAGRPLDLATCDGAAIDLDGGEHELRTAVGRDEGIDIDQLLLRSAPGGDASDHDGTLVTEAGGGRLGADPTPEAPDVQVLEENHDRLRVQVDGARPDTPFWLVLGQSHNSGWQAHIDGADLGDPRLVDGFANGWLVVPSSESFEVTLEFVPQRRVSAALWVSAIAAIGCLGLALRRPRPAYAAPSAEPEPYSPILAFRFHGALPGRLTALLAGLVLGTAAWFTAGAAVGAVVAAVTATGARHEKFRRWSLLGSPVALGLALTYVMYIQLRHAPMASFEWPIEMSRVHPLGWLAIWLLVADVVVGRIWQARSSEHTD